MTLTQIGTFNVSQMAINESVKSYLPGRENGPADAYRHILLSAELTREFGETYARALLDYHELEGRGKPGYTPEAEAMDRHNNELGIEIGKELSNNSNASWNDVINRARELIDSANNDNGSQWLDESQWDRNPTDDTTGDRIPNGDTRLNWPPTWPDGPFDKAPLSLGGLLNGMLNDAQGLLGGAAWGIADAVSGLFGSAQGYDPLVFDMDGDGIETIQINTNSPILFDHDGDGIKTATGWVKSDDALLVLDRNANGTIDNGSELFGDQTIVNGVKATDGFAALSAEDSDANGIFDANDTNFGNVRLWQDLNQNGISETNELKTLTQAGIVSISLSSTQTNITVNGGIQTAKGTFTKSDGTTGESANYIFDSNSFYREFTDTIPITEAASALPEMQGSGMVWVNNIDFKNVRRVA